MFKEIGSSYMSDGAFITSFMGLKNAALEEVSQNPCPRIFFSNFN